MQFKCQHLLPAFSLQEVQIGFIGLALALESTACSCCWIMCIHEVRKAIISLRLWVILVSTPASNNTWVCEILQYAYAFGFLWRNEMSMLVQYFDERKLIYFHYKPMKYYKRLSHDIPLHSNSKTNFCCVYINLILITTKHHSYQIKCPAF